MSWGGEEGGSAPSPGVSEPTLCHPHRGSFPPMSPICWEVNACAAMNI